MIITLTPNPAVDQTVWVDRLRTAQRSRYGRSQLDPAGKGVNVSRMAHRLGQPTLATGFLAGETGLLVQRALDAEGVRHHFIAVPGQTRIDVVVVEEASGDEMALQGPGPPVSREHLAALRQLVEGRLASARVLVLAGSLPPGVPQDAYAGFIALARAAGVPTILNAAGEPLRLALRAHPDVLKATADELEALVGRPLGDVGALIAAACGLEAGAVVVSMGLQGTIAAQGGRAWWATPPQVPQRGRVGAGDSLVAGLAVALARGDDIVSALRLGAAADAATVMTPGTGLGTAAQVAELLGQVRIEEISEFARLPAPSAREVAPAPSLPWPASLLMQNATSGDGGVWARVRRLVGRHLKARELEPPKRPVLPRERLRYGMDIDGTITQAPRHFKRLIDALLEAGDHVYIVTARFESHRGETERLLSDLGVQYSELVMRPDDWPRSIADYKVRAVRERALHLLMDDDPRNCWAIIRRTDALAGHMLPIPETPEER